MDAADSSETSIYPPNYTALHFRTKTVLPFFQLIRGKELKLSLRSSKDHVKNVYGEVKAQIHVFISLDRGEGIVSSPSCFTPG
jgi:hypothetical protein